MNRIARKREKVIDRDGLACWICGHDVRLDVKPDHGHAASIDHLRRREDGGSDRLDNLRFAHIVCNMHRDRRKDKGRGMVPLASERIGEVTPERHRLGLA